MAIIKCPECGHQISDKAPVCPNCGVEISGKVIRCPNCGEVYFKEQEMCPNCHRSFAEATQPAPPIPPLGTQSTTYGHSSSPQPNTQIPKHPTEKPAVVPPIPPTPQNTNKPTSSNGKSILIVSLIVAAIICSVCFYYYEEAKTSKEQEAYEYAMTSSDPLVLQQYLSNYPDADAAHRDSIQAHLNMLQQNDQDWLNAVVSGSKSALEEYLEKHPNSVHKQEAWNRIDSLDWIEASNQNTVAAYQAYIDAHADGAYASQAEDAMKKVKAKDVQPEERQMVSGLFRRFFQSINSRNEGGLTATCEDILSSFLGKSSATHSDVVTFMDKIYKEDVTNMNWHINNDYSIKKREVGTDEYEYQVDFSARQNVEYKDAESTETKYKVKATVSPDGKISAFNLIKIVE